MIKMKKEMKLLIVLLGVFVILFFVFLPHIINMYKEIKAYGYFKFDKPIYITIKNNKTNKKQNYKLNDNRKIHKTKYEFKNNNKVYDLRSCCDSNRINEQSCKYLSSGDENIVNIIKEISHEDHEVYFPKIIQTKNNYYAVVPLNVNWQSPYKFYLYDKHTKSLKLIHRFDGEDVVAIKD